MDTHLDPVIAELFRAPDYVSRGLKWRWLEERGYLVVDGPNTSPSFPPIARIEEYLVARGYAVADAGAAPGFTAPRLLEIEPDPARALQAERIAAEIARAAGRVVAFEGGEEVPPPDEAVIVRELRAQNFIVIKFDDV